MRSIHLLLAAAAAGATCSAACEGSISQPAATQAPAIESEGGWRTPDAVEEINFRGVRMLAERFGDQLVVEKDILVHETDIVPEHGEPHGDKANREFNSTVNRKWPNDTIFYRFGDLLARNACRDASNNPVNCNTRLTQAGYEQAIRDAMDDWERVSNIRFVQDTGNSEPAYVNIVGTDGKCSANLGRLGGAQNFSWSDRCSFNATGTRRFSTHHELGHAIGLWHEHQRTDRDRFVDVLNDAGVTDALNYAIGGARLNGYDCDSVMHYSADLQSKRDAAGNLLCRGMGQRDHLSAGDVAAVRALYPNVAQEPFTFAGTGAQALCHLSGREADANSVFDGWVSNAWVGGELVDTNLLSDGDQEFRCRVQSCFWMNDYAYPASGVTAAGNTCGSNGETFEQTRNLQVLSPGLIPVLFEG